MLGNGETSQGLSTNLRTCKVYSPASQSLNEATKTPAPCCSNKNCLRMRTANTEQDATLYIFGKTDVHLAIDASHADLGRAGSAGHAAKSRAY